MSALLRAVMHEPILADIEVSTPSPAPPPIIWLTFQQIFLIRIVLVDSAIRALGKTADLIVDFPLAVSLRLQLAVSVVNDSDRA